MNIIYGIYLQGSLLWIGVVNWVFIPSCPCTMAPYLSTGFIRYGKILSSARKPHFRIVILHNKTSSIPFFHTDPTIRIISLWYCTFLRTHLFPLQPLDIFPIVRATTLLDTVNYVLFSFQRLVKISAPFLWQFLTHNYNFLVIFQWFIKRSPCRIKMYEKLQIKKRMSDLLNICFQIWQCLLKSNTWCDLLLITFCKCTCFWFKNSEQYLSLESKIRGGNIAEIWPFLYTKFYQM